MLLISQAFCAVFSYRVLNVGLQERSIHRAKHPEPGQPQEGCKTRGSWGHQIFQPGAQSPFHLSQPDS